MCEQKSCKIESKIELVQTIYRISAYVFYLVNLSYNTIVD